MRRSGGRSLWRQPLPTLRSVVGDWRRRYEQRFVLVLLTVPSAAALRAGEDGDSTVGPLCCTWMRRILMISKYPHATTGIARYIF